MTEQPPVNVIADLENEFARERKGIVGYCYRMLGSVFEAEDATQETLLRAWNVQDSFGGRSSLRTWLYGIATNVCLDALRSSQRRALPMEMQEPAPDTSVSLPAALPEALWLQPIPDSSVFGSNPADATVARDSIRLAFTAALQHLQPQQRAVLILRDVLALPASEVATLLDTTVAAVTSNLQRARAALQQLSANDEQQRVAADEKQQQLLDRYVHAFHTADVPELLVVLHDDAILTMPPHPLWFSGADHVIKWLSREQCSNMRLLAAPPANGCPAFGLYRRSGPGDQFEAFGIQVVEFAPDTSGQDRIVGLQTFIDPALFPVFQMPAFLDSAEPGGAA